jgi:hypothetical protein
MAHIRLSRSEVRRDLLPQVCVVCGAPADVRRERSFSWFPGWIWLIVLLSWLIGLILMVVLTKSIRVRLPACDEHEGYWRRRRTFTTVGTVLVLGLCALLFAAFVSEGPPRNDDLALPLCGGGALVFFIWIVAVAIIHGRGIRATEITDRSISLAGVHEEFVWALEDDRERDWAEYETEERELRAIARERRAQRRAERETDRADPDRRRPMDDDLERRAGEVRDRDDPGPWPPGPTDR